MNKLKKTYIKKRNKTTIGKKYIYIYIYILDEKKRKQQKTKDKKQKKQTNKKKMGREDKKGKYKFRREPNSGHLACRAISLPLRQVRTYYELGDN